MVETSSGILQSGKAKQWGLYTATEGTYSIPLNITMATTSYIVGATYCVDDSGVRYSYTPKIWKESKSKSAFKAYINTSTYWFVLGQ